MGTRDNYFILLELSFDPMVSDENKIKEAIARKQQQWSKDINNPVNHPPLSPLTGLEVGACSPG